MYLKVKKISLVPDKFGKHIEITMVGLYDETDKWIKWISLSEIVSIIENAKIPFNG